jgi:hypothetical protein
VRGELALDCGEVDELFDGCEAGVVVFVAIDRAFAGVVVDVAVLEVVET